MKIYWKYGTEIDILLYIDRIIFIKIHIHVQEPVWSRVLCQSLLTVEGYSCPSDRGCTVLEVFVPQYLILLQLPFLPLLLPMVLTVHGQKCHWGCFPPAIWCPRKYSPEVFSSHEHKNTDEALV